MMLCKDKIRKDVEFLMNGLKPCPFCGGHAEIKVYNPKYYGTVGVSVVCKNCGARGRLAGINDLVISGNTISTPITNDTVERGRRQAAELWNRRVKSKV